MIKKFFLTKKLPLKVSTDVLIIGAGVIGLAIARKCALAGRDVTIIEREVDCGLKTSTHNSGVVHTGIYYPQESLKKQLSMKGKQQLHQYCLENHIRYHQVGKLVVATRDLQIATLHHLQQNALRNGVKDVELVTGFQAMQMEPNLKCIAALYCPQTGVVDTIALIKSLREDVEHQNGKFYFKTSAQRITIEGHKFITHVTGKFQQGIIESKQLINCAGLSAIAIAHEMDFLAKTFIPTLYYAKGCLYRYRGKSPFQRLIYPIPSRGGLGIHASIDVDDKTYFGPDVEWVAEPDEKIPKEKKQQFIEVISQYFPGIKHYYLYPAFASVRPKILPPEEQPQDFLLQTEQDHHISGLVNLFGIDSPGLTSCLAIADYVVERL